MRMSTIVLASVMVLGGWGMLAGTPVEASQPDLEGLWYGYAGVPGLGGGGTVKIDFTEGAYGALAHMTIPALGMVDAVIPAAVDTTPDGVTVDIAIPWVFEMSGLYDGDLIVGDVTVFYGGAALPGYWHAGRFTGEPDFPGGLPPECPGLPPHICTGSADHCGELLPFLPEDGPGYFNYPVNGETWDDQYRSFLRRDGIQLVQYAAAKVECATSDWGYGNHEPIGLGDMSEEDGSIPGTSVGYPGHPVGSHTDGKDIDVAYFQLFTPDNLLRTVGVHCSGPFTFAYHLVEPPRTLDIWRTALFVAFLSEHPRIRVIGVDGKIGPPLEAALDTLVSYGWIDHGLRESIPLVYEEQDMGWGFFFHHQHHMHVSLSPAEDVVAVADVEPDTLNLDAQGRWLTVHIELDDGLDATWIDANSVALIIDGRTLFAAEPGFAEIEDFNSNGVLDLTVKIDRQRVQAAVDPGAVEVTVIGRVDGIHFQETDTIRVID